MGTVIGAVATGQVPVHPTGNVLAAWTSPTAILTGFLFVAACAYDGAGAGRAGHQSDQGRDLTRAPPVTAVAPPHAPV